VKCSLLDADNCECGNEPSGSIKYGEFLDLLRNYLASEGLCSVKLVSFSDWYERLG